MYRRFSRWWHKSDIYGGDGVGNVVVMVPTITLILSAGDATITGNIGASFYELLVFSTSKAMSEVTFSGFSVGDVAVLALISALSGLGSFSTYMEFDFRFAKFAITLLIFLLGVWLAINGDGIFSLLLAWEVVGMVSFSLIGTGSARSLTTSSAFSAIGFNRLGDIALMIFIGKFTTHWGLVPVSGSGTAAVAFEVSAITLLIFALSLKSVVAFSMMGLPEAMEGPTPVSSLLHSCTLVMAGIFSGWATGMQFPAMLVGLFAVSGFLVCVFSRNEKDLKRSIANSTVILVGFIGILLGSSTSFAAFGVCFVHAAYKSSLFLGAGKLLANFSTYTDNIAVSRVHNFQFVILPAIMLIGFRSTAYATTKHSIDSTAFTDSSLAVTSTIVVGFSLLVVGTLSLRLISNVKSMAGGFLQDILVGLFALQLIVVTVGGTFAGQFSGSETPSSAFFVFAVFFMWLLRTSARQLPGIGSVAHSSGVFASLFSVKFEFVKLVSRFTGSGTVNSSSSSLFAMFGLGFLVLILAVVQLFRVGNGLRRVRKETNGHNLTGFGCFELCQDEKAS